MQYKFKDMLDPTLYETAQVAFVVGSHTTFNNIVCDKLRDTCLITEGVQTDANTLAIDFGVEEEDRDSDE